MPERTDRKILFAWTGVTSYMADCWRELAGRGSVDLRVVVERCGSGGEIDAARVFRGFDAKLVDPGEAVGFGAWAPDVVFAVGWRSPTVRRIVAGAEFAGVPKVCCFDMPWRWLPRCIAARWALKPILRRYRAAFVPGAVAARYARWLGFRSVHKGLFSLDTSRFRGGAGGSGFVYIGRDAPEKRLDLLRRAHARYREMGGAWPLDFYGGGGRFVQPADVPALYRGHGCLVLASEFDPWPLVLLEATAAGLPAIVSDRCGNADELGARKVRFGDVEAMARAMAEAERGEIAPAGAGRAAEYDSRVWADRVLEIAEEATA